MLQANLVELARDSPLEQGPERLDVVCVCFTIWGYIPYAVIDCSMRHELRDTAIALVLVSDKNAGLDINVITNERVEFSGLEMALADHLSDYITISLDHPDHRLLLVAATTHEPLSWIPLARLSRANERLVHFDYTRQKFSLMLLRHRLSNLHRDTPRRIAVNINVPRKLSGAYALLGIEDERES
jgi:hypothetical protein